MDQIKDEVGDTLDTRGRYEKWVQNFSRSTWKKTAIEDLGIDGTIIIKWSN